ncbi:MAG TPA: hypothetical protein VGK73_27860 [Polyangiaceae bacterium]
MSAVASLEERRRAYASRRAARSARRERSTTPAIGSRWSVRCFGTNVWEVVSVKASGWYLLLLVEENRLPGGYRLGDTIEVEREWFRFRGAMPAKAEGAVRRVA